MALPSVRDANGMTVSLGKEIGSGGEGAVFDLPGRGQSVGKIYHKPQPTDHQAKLVAMPGMCTPALLRLAAWPTETLHSPSGSVIGFIMPKITGHNPVFKLYSPKLRLQEYPKADWSFLIHAAANTARAFSAIHSHGYVIGDVNHGNLIVGHDATVRLLDCDSFQVSKGGKQWLCGVGVGTHQPPEMQALPSYAGVIRTPNHDNFGLAVIIFQLLCIARHPFMGRHLGPGNPPSIEEAIRDFRYACARDQARTKMAAPPASLPIDAMTPDLRELFETAFSPASTRGGRPTPDRWVTALDQLRSSLRACSLNPAHRYLSSLTRCPWCDIEAASGTALFPVVFVSTAGATVGIAALWQEVTRQSEPPPLPPFSEPNVASVAASASALAVGRKARRLQVGSYAALGLSAVFALASAPTGWPVGILIATGVLIAIIFGTRKPAAAGPEKVLFEQLKAELDTFRASWNAPTSGPDFAEVRHGLDVQKSKHDDLGQERARRLNQLAQQLKQKQLEVHLDRFAIATAKITGIGAAKSATLSSHGIDTASDVIQWKIMNVPGFGPVMTKRLLDWRRKCEQSFRFDPQKGIPQSDILTVERDIATSRTAIERDIAAGLGRLKAISSSAAGRRQVLNNRAAELIPQFAQAAADAKVIPGDPVTHKRLLGLAGALSALAAFMLGSAGIPKTVIAQTNIVASVPATQLVRHDPLLPSIPTDLVPDPPAHPAAQAAAVLAVQTPVPAHASIGKATALQTSNVRDAPKGSSILRELPRGTVVQIFDRRDGWSQVGDDAPWGWVYSRLLADAPP